MSLALRIGLAAALLTEGLAAAGCSAPPACACAPALAPRLTYVMTINGRSASYAFGQPSRKPLSQPTFHVRPGEKLQMTVTVSRPGHLRLTALWFGISMETWGWGGGPHGQPTGMHPILAHLGQQLFPSVHRFVLHWRVPAARSGDSFFLVSAWSSHHPAMKIDGPIAVLALNSGR